MKIVLEQLSGTTNILVCPLCFLLAFIGAFTAIAIRAGFGYKNSVDLPYRWCLTFLISDNLNNLLLGYCIAFILFQLSNQIINPELHIGFWILTGAISNEMALLLIKFSLKSKK